MALGLIGGGVVAGLIASRFRRPEPSLFAERVLARAGLPIQDEEEELGQQDVPDDQPGVPRISPLPAFEAEVTQPGVTFAQVVDAIPQLAPHVNKSEHDLFRQILLKRFAAAEASLAVQYLAAWNLGDRSAFDQLAASAAVTPPIRYANYALGRVELKRKDYASAYQSFRKEGERTDAYEARYRAILSLLKARDFTTVATLEKNPAYHELFTPYVRLKIAAGKRDWRTILLLSPRLQFARYQPAAVAISLVAGFAWILFLAHLGEWKRPFSGTAGLSVLGFIGGVLSTVPTLFVIIWQEDVLKVAAGEEPIRILLYCIAGVGVREEVCKLLLFLPLLPILWKRDDELEALIVASFVGLGFAIEENVSYFVNSEATSAAGRFLTANFFHIALTGVNGLALFRAVRWGMRGLNEFLWIFPMSIVAHGAYDALLSMPALDQASYGAMAVFVGYCMFYFNKAQELRTNRPMTVSLTGIFVFGVSLLAATLVGYEIATLGFRAGATLITTELLGSAVMLFMFFRIFNEPLTP